MKGKHNGLQKLIKQNKIVRATLVNKQKENLISQKPEAI